MIFFRLFLGYLLQIVPFAVLSLYPFSSRTRFSAKKTQFLTSALIFVLAIVFAGIGCCLQTVMPHDHTLFDAVNLVFLLALLPCFLWYLYVVKMAWQKKLFIFSFALLSALMITFISNIFSDVILSSGAYDGLPYQGWSLPVLLLSTAVLLPFFFLILIRYYTPVEAKLAPKENTYLSILSLILFLIFAGGLSFLDSLAFYNTLSLLLFSALFTAVFVIYIIFFKMLYFAHQKMELQQEADHTRHLLSLQAEQYRHICENVESSRRMRHDLRHHMVMIQGFLQNGEAEQAKAYAERCMEYIKQYETVKFCDNGVVNMMVGYYQTLAAERGIAFTVRIAIPEQTAMQDEDLSVLVGNLLENAITAAEHAGDAGRYIHLNMICSGKMLAITVDNGFDGVVQMEDGRYVSTKAKHNGIGLQSIERIAQKYNGGVEFAHEGQVFHSSVMLGIGSQPV